MKKSISVNWPRYDTPGKRSTDTAYLTSWEKIEGTQRDIPQSSAFFRVNQGRGGGSAGLAKT